MEEQEIVALFWQRSEQAIAQANIKYGRLLQQLCGNILGDDRETEECVSDTLLALWNTIPPENPAPLTAYACRIARNLALKKASGKKRPKAGQPRIAAAGRTGRGAPRSFGRGAVGCKRFGSGCRRMAGRSEGNRSGAVRTAVLVR